MKLATSFGHAHHSQTDCVEAGTGSSSASHVNSPCKANGTSPVPPGKLVLEFAIRMRILGYMCCAAFISTQCMYVYTVVGGNSLTTGSGAVWTFLKHMNVK